MDKIKEELLQGEELLWSGVSESFETLDKTNKSACIRKAIIIFSVVAALCIFYIVYAGSKGIDLKPGLIIIVMALALVASFNFYAQANKLRRGVYAITDQRIISIIDTPKSVELSRIKYIQMKTDEDGHVSILCGKQVIESKSHQWRALALLDPSIEAETGICERFVIYAISDAETVKRVLSDFLPI